VTAAAPHLRAILIAGALAATAVALAFTTMVRQRALPAAPSVATPHHVAKAPAAPSANAWVAAALATGLPKRVAAQFARHEVVVVTLYSPSVALDRVVAGEARAGAALGSAGFVAVDVGKGPAADKLTDAFGVLSAPTTLVLARGAYGAPVTRLDGFDDRQTVAQAALNADPTPGGAAQSAWARRAQSICRHSHGDALIARLAATKGPRGAKALVVYLRRDLAQTRRLAAARGPVATAKQASAAAHVRSLALSLGAPACAQPF
jgi:hypothetical protein